MEYVNIYTANEKVDGLRKQGKSVVHTTEKKITKSSASIFTDAGFKMLDFAVKTKWGVIVYFSN